MNGAKLKASEASRLFESNNEAFEHFRIHRNQRSIAKLFGVTSLITPLCMVRNVLNGNGLLDYLGRPAIYSAGALGFYSILMPKSRRNAEEAVRIYNNSIKSNDKLKLLGL